MSAEVETLEDVHWTLRTQVYRYFAATAHPPSLDELSRTVAMPPGDVRSALEALECHHHLALLPDRSGIWMAHPFSAIATDFPVDTGRGRFWANCAWDALGISAILGIDGWTEARCAASGEPISFGTRGGRREGDPGIVHLVVPPREAWDDIGFT